MATNRENAKERMDDHLPAAKIDWSKPGAPAVPQSGTAGAAVEQPTTTLTGEQLHKFYVEARGGVDEGLVAVANAAIATHLASQSQAAQPTQSNEMAQRLRDAVAAEDHAFFTVQLPKLTILAASDEIDHLAAAKSHLIQQAQIWHDEAKTQRATVLDILRHFGLPENDWEAKRLIIAHLAGQSQATMQAVPAGKWTISRLHDMGTVSDERGELVAQTYFSTAKAFMDAHNASLAAPVAKEAPAVPDILFDGFAVYAELTRHLGKQHCFSPDAVSATLDAVVRLLRRAAPTAQEVTQQAAPDVPSDSLCPACQGSGEGLMMEGAGPDAYEVPCNCPYCKGSGCLLDAYHGLVELLAAEREKYLQLCGKVAFADMARPTLATQQAAKAETAEQAEKDEQQADADPELSLYVAYGDDDAVDLFAKAMKAKMAASRAKGRGGWHDPDDCPAERLQVMLIDHLAKGDPVDVGNFAMMLWNRGERVIAPTTSTVSAPAEPVAKVTAGEVFGPGLAFLANGKDLPKVGALLYTAPSSTEGTQEAPEGVRDGWISVGERLPELYQTVALLDEKRWMNTGSDDHSVNWHGSGYLCEFGHKYWSIFGEMRSQCLDAVTHWMPLPAAPSTTSTEGAAQAANKE
jgi:hypothetical protein